MKASEYVLCPGCAQWIVPGQEAAVLLGLWCHPVCKQAELQRRIAAAGPVVEVPAVEPSGGTQTVGVKFGNRVRLRRLHGRGRR